MRRSRQGTSGTTTYYTKKAFHVPVLASGRQCVMLACPNKFYLARPPYPTLTAYESTPFRIVRKALEEGRLPESVDVLLASYYYGFVDVRAPRPAGAPYDWHRAPLTRDPTQDPLYVPADQAYAALARRFQEIAYGELVLCLDDHTGALVLASEEAKAHGVDAILLAQAKAGTLVIRHLEGPMGTRHRLLREWIDRLNAETAGTPLQRAYTKANTGQRLTKADGQELARHIVYLEKRVERLEAQRR